MDYVQKLITKMEAQGEEKAYIELCATYAQKLCDNNVPVIFDFKHLSLLLGYEPMELTFYLYAPEESFYTRFQIPKKSGGVRDIEVPSDRLKSIQRWILRNILENIMTHDSCYGFKKGKSIYDNALLHVGKDCVLNMDLKDFFPSITQEDVFYVFYNMGYTKKVSYYLAKFLTKAGVLPQGSPASPIISNIVAEHMDKRLSKLAESYNAIYSRYADDITFSGATNITNMIPAVRKIVCEENFQVNEEKTRYSYYYQRQEVTGLIVNKKVSIPKEYLRELKQEIYYCKKYGVNSHLQKTENHKSFYKEHIYGKAYFVKMTDEEKGKEILNELDSIIWDY